MPYNSAAIANFFIGAFNAVESRLTPTKLQKLVYFAHGWHLAIHDAPLIDEKIQASQSGPMIFSLYHNLRGHQNASVMALIKQPQVMSECGRPLRPLKIMLVDHSLDDCPEAKPRTSSLLRGIWAIYGEQDSMQLSSMTHEAGGPWDQIRQKFPQRLPPGEQIPDDVIKEFFRKRREVEWDSKLPEVVQ